MEKFQRESLTSELIDELLPSLVMHDKAYSHNPEEPLNPDYQTYLRMEAAGALRVFTARSEKTGAMLGYSVFFVAPHLQKKHLIQADENLRYTHPEAKGFGPRFAAWTEEQLRAEGGIHIICRTAKARSDINCSAIYERQGYELSEIVYSKRLDREAS